MVIAVGEDILNQDLGKIKRKKIEFIRIPNVIYIFNTIGVIVIKINEKN